MTDMQNIGKWRELRETLANEYLQRNDGNVQKAYEELSAAIDTLVHSSGAVEGHVLLTHLEAMTFLADLRELRVKNKIC